MSKVLTVIAREYLERVRSKSFVIGTVLGPALMSMFIVLPALMADKGGDDRRTIAIVDQSGVVRGPLSDALVEDGRKSLTLEPVAVGAGGLEAAITEMKTMIVDDTVHSGVVVPADFVETGKVSFYNKSVSSLVVRDEMLKPALNRVLREQRFSRSQVPDSLFNYLSARTDWNSIAVTAEGGEETQDESVSFIMAFALIMIIYIMVIMYGNHTLTAVIEEKSSRMVEVLLASVSPGEMMLGKVLGIGAAGLTQFGIWAAGFFLLSQRGVSMGEITLDVGFLTPVILGSFVMFFLLGFFLYATIYAGVGAMCNTIQDSQQFHMPLTMCMVIPMMMLTMVLRSPNSTISTVLSLVPLFSPVLMFMRVCVETPPFWQIGLSWLLMGLSIWLSARLAGKLFRVGILMYGQAPTWATIARALRS
ncbi:MAG: ABC transporter permease [bacterium]|nr:ABC transporter permease [bacterium]